MCRRACPSRSTQPSGPAERHGARSRSHRCRRRELQRQTRSRDLLRRRVPNDVPVLRHRPAAVPPSGASEVLRRRCHLSTDARSRRNEVCNDTSGRFRRPCAGRANWPADVLCGRRSRSGPRARARSITVAWFRRQVGAQATLDRDAFRADREHLEGFAAARTGVEAFIEPRTNVTQTTVILIAHDGEWTRRRRTRFGPVARATSRLRRLPAIRSACATTTSARSSLPLACARRWRVTRPRQRRCGSTSCRQRSRRHERRTQA